MRVDNIDLIGEFKIKGLTAVGSQALGLSGGALSFIEVTGGGGGGNEGLIKKSGYNYVLVQADGVDSLSNGSKLIQAYSEAVTLSTQVGTLSVDNRITVLLTPGEYYLPTDTQINLESFIDIVGISTNPYDTKIRMSYDSVNPSSFLIGSSVDMSFNNIWIDTADALILNDSGSGSGNYFRWKNLILSGHCFYEGSLGYALYDMDGEFENIKFLPNPVYNEYFAKVSNNISGKFKNIDLGNTIDAFWSQNGYVSGVFENVKNINTTGAAFYTDAGGTISGRFQNITLTLSGGVFVFIQSSGLIDGVFRDIYVSGQCGSAFIGFRSGNSNFTDIVIEDLSSVGGIQCFYDSFGVDSYGTFKNIRVGNVSGEVFSNLGNIYATFSNIVIGNCGYCFNCDPGVLNGTFEKIKIGDITNYGFYAGYLEGTFKDISGGNFANLFYGNASINATVENVTFGDSSGGQAFFTSSGNIEGTFKDIRLGSGLLNAFYAGGIISGRYKNIQVKSLSVSLFEGSSEINCEIDGLINSSNANFLKSTGGNIYGTYSNIFLETVNSGSTFYGATIDLKLDGFTILNSGGISHFRAGSDIMGEYRNIKIKGTHGEIFHAELSTIPTLVENLEIDSVGTFVYGGQFVDGTYRNLIVGSSSISAFYSFSSTVNGTFSNIRIDTANVLFSGISQDVNVDNMKVGHCSTFFTAPGSNTKVNKLEMVGAFLPYVATNNKYYGVISNSRIDMRESGDYVWFTSGSQVERCKILTDNSSDSLISDSVIVFTMTNESQSTSGFTYGNIIESSIVS